MTTTREPSDFALALNQLVAQRWPRDARSANFEIAAAVSEMTSRAIDRQYIYRLRKGTAVKSVSSDVRDAICRFFDVPLSYFSVAPTTEGTLTEQMTAHGLAVAGLRSTELSEEGARDLSRIFEEASEILRRERR